MSKVTREEVIKHLDGKYGEKSDKLWKIAVLDLLEEIKNSLIKDTN